MTADPPGASRPIDAGLAASLRDLDVDGRLLFASRMLRMFAYGSLAVVLVLYLASLGLDPVTIGLVLTLTLIGDTLMSLWLTTNADRIGRRRALLAGAILMVVAGIAFAATSWVPLLILAATVGVISPTGSEVGPFLAIEQASLSQTTHDDRRTAIFAWYNLAGYVAAAFGALAAGIATQAMLDAGFVPSDAYRLVVVSYAAIGAAMAVLFLRIGPSIEAPPSDPSDGLQRRLGLGRSRGIVARLSTLFAVDAFAGGFIPQSLIAYWFHLKFNVEPAVLGTLFFGTNVLAAVSSLSAARIARKIGLIKTMVFTHLPSNVILMLVPLMPTLPLAVLLLLIRSLLSQMDVPTRQSYVMAVVDPSERSAAAGVTGIARTTGSALSPVLSTPLVATASLAVLPFFIAGGLKIVYDLALYRMFQSTPPKRTDPES